MANRSYFPPDRADCHTRQWITAADDSYRLRFQTIAWRQKGRLTDFVINAQVLTADEWETVEYVDCCHGYCHLHTRNNESPRPIAPLNCVDDVQVAYTSAVALIHDRLRIIRVMRKASAMRARKALDAFRVEVDWNLACGVLADHDLPVTSDDGDHVVVVALAEEPLSILLGRLRAVGGYANLFVKGAQGLRMVSVIKDDCAIGNPDEDMTRPGANATVGMFLDYLNLRPNGLRLSMVNPAQPAVARDSQNVEFAAL